MADIPEALARAKDKEQAGKAQAAMDHLEAAFGVPEEELTQPEGSPQPTAQ
jgi:hypothetical protein